MKTLLILLLFPLVSFGQWEYKEVIDSIGKDIYLVANNNNVSMTREYDELTLGLNVESDKHVRDGVMNIKLVFISETQDYTYLTTGRCSKGFVTISNSLHAEQYLKYLKLATNIEIHLQVKTNVMWLTYQIESKNFNEAYNFLTKH